MHVELFDTHTHIHFKDYGLDPEDVWKSAVDAGVTRMLAVGCDIESSENAVKFAQSHENVWAVVGVHPHQATKFLKDTSSNLQILCKLLENASYNKIVAIGEFGLDYHYDHSDKASQIMLLRLHFELVQKYKFPAVFHIRDAFADFWPIFDDFNSSQVISGVVHCFTGTGVELNEALERDLFIALNGIMTFTQDENQIEAAKRLPLQKLILETDAPYLTPKPFRGNVCKPEHVRNTAEFLADLRGETLEQLAQATTNNAVTLFKTS